MPRGEKKWLFHTHTRGRKGGEGGGILLPGERSGKSSPIKKEDSRRSLQAPEEETTKEGKTRPAYHWDVKTGKKGSIYCSAPEWRRLRGRKKKQILPASRCRHGEGKSNFEEREKRSTRAFRHYHGERGKDGPLEWRESPPSWVWE